MKVKKNKFNKPLAASEPGVADVVVTRWCVGVVVVVVDELRCRFTTGAIGC
jgi:hypothetical protein